MSKSRTISPAKKMAPFVDTPLLVVEDDTLCRVKVWSDGEYRRLAFRPLHPGRASGLGWVGLVPIRALEGRPPASGAADRRDGVHRGAPAGMAERRVGDRRRITRVAGDDNS